MFMWSLGPLLRPVKATSSLWASATERLVAVAVVGSLPLARPRHVFASKNTCSHKAAEGIVNTAKLPVKHWT